MDTFPLKFPSSPVKSSSCDTCVSVRVTVPTPIIPLSPSIVIVPDPTERIPTILVFPEI